MRARSRLGEILFRLGLFVLPFALAFVYVVSLLAVMSLEAWYVIFGGMATYLLAPVGTEIVIPVVFVGLFGIGAQPLLFALAVTSVVLVDAFTALFFLWNWDLVERVPRLGGVVRRIEEKCHSIIEKRRWGERATYAALAAYVAMPFQMTGGLFGSVLGRIMGLDRTKVFLAVAAGSLAGGVPMGLLAYYFIGPVYAALTSPTVQIVGLTAGILITAAFVGAIVYLYARGRRIAD
ncbi:MAG TPA: small multi-drug export protein [Thermoplasmata archaeon]|nr:small multi-drug export protein [Thermoplasmata archaeon]